MSEWTQAKTAIESSISSDKTYMALQDVPATLAAMFATVDAIRASLEHWARAAAALIAVGSSADNLSAALSSDPELVALAKAADSFAAHVVELKSIVTTFAAKARA